MSGSQRSEEIDNEVPITKKALKKLRILLTEYDQSKQDSDFWARILRNKMGSELNLESFPGLETTVFKVAKVNNFLAIYFKDHPGDPYGYKKYGGLFSPGWSGDNIRLLNLVYKTKNLICFGGGDNKLLYEENDNYFNIYPRARCRDNDHEWNAYVFGQEKDWIKILDEKKFELKMKESLLKAEKAWNALVSTDKNYARLRAKHFQEFGKVNYKIDELIFDIV